MGNLRDIVDIAKNISKDKDLKNLLRSKSSMKSLSKKASEGTVQFPVIISSSMDIETAQNITKALERNFATFVQIVFSMDPTLVPADGTSAADYIKKFHQNMDMQFSGSYDVIHSVSEAMNTLIESDTYVIESAVYDGSTTKIVASNKEQLVDLLDHVRHDILNNKYVPKVETMYNFKNPELNQKYNSMRFESVTEAVRKPDDITVVPSKDPNFAKDMLRDNDVKKSNELVATTLHIRINMMDKNGSKVTSIDFIVGVKAIMPVVRSSEMIENMVAACQNDDGVFNFLRWTTGEISFFKDFLFNINGTKHDVYKASSGSSPWWLALKRRKTLASMTDRNIFTRKRILPNASIVLTEDEVELIRTEYGYDLHKPIFVNRIMQSYFLLGFVIVDSSAQIAHFMFDGQSDFQSITFSALEKANTSDERKFKEMLKVINRT